MQNTIEMETLKNPQTHTIKYTVAPTQHITTIIIGVRGSKIRGPKSRKLTDHNMHKEKIKKPLYRLPNKRHKTIKTSV